MNYTETYNRVYNALSNIDITHEKRHNSSIRITNALNDIFVYTNKQFPEAVDGIIGVINEYMSSIKLGQHE